MKRGVTLDRKYMAVTTISTDSSSGCYLTTKKRKENDIHISKEYIVYGRVAKKYKIRNLM